jgi:hypothetical protein
VHTETNRIRNSFLQVLECLQLSNCFTASHNSARINSLRFTDGRSCLNTSCNCQCSVFATRKIRIMLFRYVSLWSHFLLSDHIKPRVRRNTATNSVFHGSLCTVTQLQSALAYIFVPPFTVAARSKARIVFAGSNPTQSMDVCGRSFCLCCSVCR